MFGVRGAESFQAEYQRLVEVWLRRITDLEDRLDRPSQKNPGELSETVEKLGQSKITISDKLFPEAGQSADVQQRQVLGLLLTWLQDKVSQTFVIATLNRLDSLPPELTRLGRFDEIFYVGFPQNGERKDILHLHLARFDERYKDGLSPLSDKDWRVVINQTVNLTGAELSIMVEKAARRLFHQGEKVQIELAHLLAIRKEITPLFVRDTDRILKIENIAKGIATPCSSPDSSIFAPEPTNLWGKGLEQKTI